MAHSYPTGQEPAWGYLLSELVHATEESLAPEDEQTLLDILHFEGELQLDETSEMPHSMSPESMLKSLSMQILGKWTGTKHLAEIRRFEVPPPASLACIARAVIERIFQNGGTQS